MIFLGDTTGLIPSSYRATVQIQPKDPKELDIAGLTKAARDNLKSELERAQNAFIRVPPEDTPPGDEAIVTVLVRPVASGETIPVTMRRALNLTTDDQSLWVAIRNSHQGHWRQVSFQLYAISFCGRV